MEMKEKEFGQQRHSLLEKIEEQICSGGTFCCVSCYVRVLWVSPTNRQMFLFPFFPG
jgi:hypothetical protein